MDIATANILNECTGRFYRTCAESFSQTRHAAWAGWSRALDGPAGEAFAGRDQAMVLDVACGNLRFARFLRERYPACDLRVHAVDNCAELVGEPALASFRELDIVAELLAGTLDAAIDVPPCDLVACFGFLHHVPGHENRARLLRTLAGRVAPGGYLVVSFWQFLNSPELARKAQATHARGLEALVPTGLDPAQLEVGDYLLGWQDAPDVFRYCHSFTSDEVDSLVREAGLEARVADHFEADGRTGNLNSYLVLSSR